jgi:mannose-6-phosphate isomerase-like protein (cupin superfamily)
MNIMKCTLALGTLMMAALVGMPAFGQSSAMPKLGVFSGPNRTGLPAGPAAKDGTGMFWSNEDMKKAYGPSNEVTMGNFAWTPIYRLSFVQRPYRDPAVAESEMHEDKTQIYVIISGTGTQILGGKPAKDNVSPEGQHNSMGPLQGGKSYGIKPGDLILIPPMTWHQTLPDSGQTLTYQMIHIETRTRMP